MVCRARVLALNGPSENFDTKEQRPNKFSYVGVNDNGRSIEPQKTQRKPSDSRSSAAGPRLTAARQSERSPWRLQPAARRVRLSAAHTDLSNNLIQKVSCRKVLYSVKKLILLQKACSTEQDRYFRAASSRPCSSLSFQRQLTIEAAAQCHGLQRPQAWPN